VAPCVFYFSFSTLLGILRFLFTKCQVLKRLTMLLPAASPASIALVVIFGFLAPRFAASRVAATHCPNFKFGFAGNAFPSLLIMRKAH